mgnify:CR=1 FL=1
MKENMEKQDTMDNEYGHTGIPPILKPLDIREKYWGKITSEGDVYHVPKGVMHMRMSLEDSIIVEIASNDTDADSHIVEDGKHYEWTE